MYTDPSGLRSGDAFGSAHDAALDILRYINPSSVMLNREYGGIIYRSTKDGKYYATEPVKGTASGANPSQSSFPNDAEVVGDYHTHADYSIRDPATGKIRQTGDPSLDNLDSDNFSQTDLDGIAKDATKLNQPNYTGYLGTPSGKMKEYDPAKNQTTTTGSLPTSGGPMRTGEPDFWTKVINFFTGKDTSSQ